MPRSSPAGSLGERKHRFVQSEINETALSLFVDKGFERTTVDEIARAAGISRRTFFRYFETKEDVIVTILAESGGFLLTLIRDQKSDLSPLPAMQASIRGFLTHYQRSDPRAWQVLHLIQSTPKLRARFLHQRDHWLQQIALVLTERSVPVMQAEVAAAMGLGILTVVYDRWHQDKALDVGQAVDDAFSELLSLTHPMEGPD